jgi:hypothetical protein
MTLLTTALVTAAGVSLAVMVVLLTVAAHSAREARATIFPIVREEEMSRVRRARLGGLVAGTVAAAMAAGFFAVGQIPSSTSVAVANEPEDIGQMEAVTEAAPILSPEPTLPVQDDDPAPTPSATVIMVEDSTPVNESEDLPVPTETSIPSATPLPSPTFEATATPIATLTPVPPSPTPKGTPLPAPDSASLGPIVFSPEIDGRRNAVGATDRFSEGMERVYAVFPYAGMENGLSWTQVWYFNGEEFVREQAAWEYGQTDRSFVFIKPVGAGDYKLEIFVNDELVSSAKFTVVGPTAIGGPEQTETP